MTHAIVTGGTRGIGRATALALAAAGAAVTVNFRSDQAAASAAVAALEQAGAAATAVRADVTDPDDVRRLFAEARAAHGPPDVLVANVGVPGFGPVDDVGPDEFERVFGAITRATFVLLQEGARQLADGGSIVVVSSGAAVTPGPGGGLYGAAKAAIDFWGTTLAKELGPRGIRVNSVMPGLTDTDGMILPPEQADALVARTPLGRLGRPEEVADVIAFLAGDGARWVTGQRFAADGGLI